MDRRARGFTLVEVIIALVIFGLASRYVLFLVAMGIATIGEMMTAPVTEVLEKCQRLMALLKDTGDARLNAEIVDGVSRAGGGSFPLLEIPTKCLSIEIAGLSPDSLETALRGNRPPVIGRIEKEMLLMDMRTVAADELPVIRDALLAVLNR